MVTIGAIPGISLSRSLAIVVAVVAVSLHSRSVPHITRVHGPVVSGVHHVHHGPVVGVSLRFSIGLSLGFSLSLSLSLWFSSGLSLGFSISRPLAIVVAVVSLLHTISVPHVTGVHGPVVHVVHVPVVTTVGAVVGISISSGFSLSRSLAIVVT